MATSCLRLDDFLFNNNENRIDEYMLGDYGGEVEFNLPDSLKISSDNVHLFQIESNLNGDKKMLYAVYIGDISRIATDTVILYCHGNKDHLDFYFPRFQLLAWTGGLHRYGVMMFDYRGYGLSEGTPSEDGLYADTDAALLWLSDKGLTSDRLILYGFSMGSAPATELAAYERSLRPSKLILEAPFASAEVFVQDGTGLAMPGSYFVNLKINNADKIKDVSQPLLWIHGINDSFLNIYTHGEVVFKNYGGVKGYACRVAGANHSQAPPMLGFKNYLDILNGFISNSLDNSNLVTVD
jgi:pimeloyl-ACP methyl ester carboxylesterase